MKSTGKLRHTKRMTRAKRTKKEEIAREREANQALIAKFDEELRGVNESLPAGLESGLCAAEAVARVALADHADDVEAKAAELPTEVQEARHLLMQAGFSFDLEHDDPKHMHSRVPAHRCQRCKAARALLGYAGMVRHSLQHGGGEAAAFYALHVGILGMRLEQKELEDYADVGLRYRFAGGRGETKRRREEQKQWQVMLNEEAIRDPEASYPELRWRVASKLDPPRCDRTIRRHCRDPHTL